MRFIPVQLCQVNVAVPEPDASDAFHFPSATFAIEAPKPGQVPDASADGNRLNLRQFSEDHEVLHGAILAPAERVSAESMSETSTLWTFATFALGRRPRVVSALVDRLPTPSGIHGVTL